jgi:hypothetical protein
MLPKSVSEDLRFEMLPDDTCRYLAALTIAHLDKNGVMHATPAIWKAKVAPTREDIDSGRAAQYLEAMSKAGLVAFFVHGGRRFLFWKSFEEDQVGLRPERESTELPTPPSEPRQSSGNLPESSRQPSGKMPAEGEGEVQVQGEVQVEERGAPAAAGDAPPSLSQIPPSGVLSSTDHPAVKAWVEQLKPTKAAQARSKEISDLVGTSPEELQAWQTVLNIWRERDHNKNLVENLTSRYKKVLADLRGEKASQNRPPSNNGRQSKRGTYRLGQKAYTDAEREQSRQQAEQQRAAVPVAERIATLQQQINNANEKLSKPGANQEYWQQVVESKEREIVKLKAEGVSA